MKYEKPEMEMEVFDSEIWTLSQDPGEGDITPWPGGDNPDVQNSSMW